MTRTAGRLTIPAFHVKPLFRLQNPTFMRGPDGHPAAPLCFRNFRPVLRAGSRSRALVYDPNTKLRPRLLQFSADFECGNLGQVFAVGPRQYEIHMLPDPTPYYSASWYFFKVRNLSPGEYTFTIAGFFRDAQLHQLGVQPVAFSMNAAARGIGWHRFGNDMNFWCSKRGTTPEYALSFTFSVAETDTIYFAYLYPYTYTDLIVWLNSQQSLLSYSILCQSHGGVDVPAVFWDADAQKCLNLQNMNIPMRNMRGTRQPLIVIAARHHPGEPNASIAMEDFSRALFSRAKDSVRLLKHFSFLLLPMINVDGVICGYYRPSISGYDMNRSWGSPNKAFNPVEYEVLSLLDKLARTRPVLFFLDFHGHSAQCNSFTYGVWNDAVPFNNFEELFPKIMSRNTSLFDLGASTSLPPDAFPGTMRVALHHRYEIPFVYTLEMSFGGIDIGTRSHTQMTPSCYREIGVAVVRSMAMMLLDQVPLSSIIEGYVPLVRAL